MFLSFLVLDSSWVNCKAINRIITVAEDVPGAGLLAITSPDRVHRDWQAARVRGERSVASGYWRGCGRAPPSSPSATSTRRLVMAGCAVAGTTIVALGVDRFGQSGDIPDLYRAYGIDTEAILAAAPRACLTALRQTE